MKQRGPEYELEAHKPACWFPSRCFQPEARDDELPDLFCLLRALFELIETDVGGLRADATPQTSEFSLRVAHRQFL
jgi:hypothetical protein